jgi:uncharacterized membrane protein
MSMSTPQADASAGRRRPPGYTLAQAMGWGSLALGIPQTTMPGRFCQAIGVRDDAGSRAWTLAVGIREHAAAAGILVINRERPVPWLWGRVAGDVMDLTLLMRAWNNRRKRQSATRLAIAMGGVVTTMACDLTAAIRMTGSREQGAAAAQPGLKHASAAITVRQPPDEVFRFWHDFENLPRFMAHLESVEQLAGGRSRWVATAPAGRKVEWQAEVIEEVPNELIAWQSLEDGGVDNAGVVRFMPAPGGRGTEIHLDMDYATPGGAVGATIAKLFGEEPQQQVRDDLRRFKQVVETGVIVRSEGSPEGPHTGRLMRQRPAQPLPAG